MNTMAISLETQYTKGFIDAEDWEVIQPRVTEAHEILHSRRGAGNEYLGWLSLPTDYDRHEFERIRNAAQRIRESSDALIVIGIGGSYLGARAAVEFLKTSFYNSIEKTTPDIYFVGNSLSAFDIQETLRLCSGKRISINVISKSGTTVEPGIAFRIFRDYLIRMVGPEEARKRIYVTADRSKGVLKALADREGYESFVVPNNIGGRFSVLTAVGLLPIAVAGGDIDAIMAGAATAMEELYTPYLFQNPCYRYAASRHLLMQKGRSVELLVSGEPRCVQLGEWWKQLFAESEGKNGKGLFPTTAIFTTDLHSIGQFIQQGTPLLFETAVMFDRPANLLGVEFAADNFDSLNYLSGKTIHDVNRIALLSALLSHMDGGTPSLLLTVPAATEDHLGYLFYFFEKACAISAYMLGINPFNQPGVEGYKRNMFALLGRPGFEARRRDLERRMR